MQTNQQEPIAIIGMGCRFPGASTTREFWKRISVGKDAIREVPVDRWNIDELYDPDPTRPGKLMSRWGGFIDQFDQFDWRTLRIPPREARYMDPQQRLLLEVTWEALEDAGSPFPQIMGSKTGVYIGIGWSDYLRLQSRNWSQLDGYTAMGSASCFAANRLSYVFGLKGPSISLDVGCTSSLAAIYLACQSLWSGETSMAIAGGVSLMLSPDSTIMVSKAGLLSPDGRCKTLDAQANGFVRGEGAGVIVLKPLSLVKPSDRVYAYIRGITMNHNGHNEWIIAANQEAQESLLRDTYRSALIEPTEVDYVELHGTGFLRGDAIEVNALAQVIGARPTRKHSCMLGSVKTNIGHLEAAAGIASVIKVSLSLYHRQIPPTLHLQTLNENIPLQDFNLAAPKVACDWPEKEGALLAGVTTLSFTGANAHAILSSDPLQINKMCSGQKRDDRLLPSTQLLVFSARSEPALYAQAVAFKDFLDDEETISKYTWRDICYSASVRRTHHEWRLAIVGNSARQAAASLDALIRNKDLIKSNISQNNAGRRKQPAFLFARQESQWFVKENESFLQNAVVRAVLEEGNHIYHQFTETPLFCHLAENAIPHREHCTDADVAHVVLQIALATLWRSWGIEPGAVIGEGLGEIAAANVAGIITLKEAIFIVLQQKEGLAIQDHGRIEHTAPQPVAAQIPAYLLMAGVIAQGTDLATTSWQKLVDAPKLSVTMVDQFIIDSHTICVELGSPSTLSRAILTRSLHHNQTGTVLTSLRREQDATRIWLEALDVLYTQGHTINWQAWYDENCRYVDLPTYSWQRERVWLDWLDLKEVSTPPEKRIYSNEPERHEQTHLTEESHKNDEEGLLYDLERVPVERRRDILLTYVTSQVMKLLELDPASAPTREQKLFAFGMNSITATQLVARLQTDLKCTLPSILVFNYPTIESLTSFLLSEIVSLDRPLNTSTKVVINAEKRAEQHKQQASLLPDLGTLSEEEAITLLIEKLAFLEQSL